MEGKTTNDLFAQETKSTGTLKVLTTLTYIGCGLAYISTLYSYINDSNYEKDMARMTDMADNASGVAGKVLQESIVMAQRAHENKTILLLSGLLFTTLCLIGAMQMRKLKKSGYPLYLIGEIAPLAVFIGLVGFSLVGSIALALSSIVALVFIILYTVQRKNLIY